MTEVDMGVCFETSNALDARFALSEKDVLNELDELDALVDEMEDGVEQGDEVWQRLERILTANNSLALDRKELYLLKEQQGPLMQLFRKKPPVRIVELILDHWPEDVQISDVTDDNGTTILFHAIQGGASVRVIERIVKNDSGLIDPLTLLNHRYPIAEACVRASKLEEFDVNSKRTIRYLMKEGRGQKYGISPLVATIGNRDISDEVIEFILDVGDPQFRKEMLEARSPASGLTPLQIALLNNQRSDKLIARLLEHEEFFSFDVLDNLLARGRAGSRLLQSLVNRKMTERWPVAVLLFGLYVRAALIVVFVQAAVHFFENRDAESHVALYCCASYFVLMELFEFRFRGPTYILDFWNVFDIACVVLLLVSSIGMEKYRGDGRNAPEWLKGVILLSGGMVVWSLILYLRAAFLPFAIFVGGVIRILKTLVPFLVVSALMVFGFSFMFFVQRIGDTCCCTETVAVACIERDEDNEDACIECDLSETVLETLQFFYSGPSRTDAVWLDQVFGVAAVIILMNVVIAIVSGEWEDNKQRAGAQFWGYRIRFLAEVYSLGSIRNCFPLLLGRSCQRQSMEATSARVEVRVDRDSFWDDRDSAPPYQLSELKKGRFNLFKAIDDLGRWSITDSTPWVEPPFETRIYNANDYYRYTLGFMKYDKQTAEWLSKEDYKKLISCGSFERNWYWASQPNHKVDRLKFPYVKSRPQIVLEFAIYLLLIPLGFITVGLLWPRRVREMLFGVGMGEENEDTSEDKVESKRASVLGVRRASGVSVGYVPHRSTRAIRSLRQLPASSSVKSSVLRKFGRHAYDSIGTNETRTRLNTIERDITQMKRQVNENAESIEKFGAKLDLMLKMIGTMNMKGTTGKVSRIDE